MAAHVGGPGGATTPPLGAGGAPSVQCWACGVLVQVPMVGERLARVFRCGWCGAVSEAAPVGGWEAARLRRGRRRGVWRSVMRALSRLSYGVVVLVLGLTASIVLPGVALVLPVLCPHPAAWLLHTTLSYGLLAAVVFNYLAAVFTSAGSVRECHDGLPASLWADAAGAAPGAAADAVKAAAAAADAGASGVDAGAGGGAGGGEGGAGAKQGAAHPSAAAAHAAAASGPDAAAGAAAATDGCSTSGGGPAAPGPHAAPPPPTPTWGGPPSLALQAPGPVHASADRAADAEGPPAALAPSHTQQQAQQQAAHALVPHMAYAHLSYCWPCRGPHTPNSVHCHVCGTCVVDLDHHCPFIANCVGRGNMRNFLSFLATTVLAMAYSAAVSAWLLYSERAAIGAALAAADAAMRFSSGAGAEAGLGAGAAMAAALASVRVNGERLPNGAEELPPEVAAMLAAAAANRSGGGDGALLGGRRRGGLARSGWVGWVVRLCNGIVTWLIAIIVRSPLHVTAAAYILAASLAIMAAVGVLLGQTLRHIMHEGGDCASSGRSGSGGAQGASGCEGCDGRRGWSRVAAVMYGSGGGSAWMWVWPMWGPPPGVLRGAERAQHAAAAARRKPKLA